MTAALTHDAWGRRMSTRLKCECGACYPCRERARNRRVREAKRQAAAAEDEARMDVVAREWLDRMRDYRPEASLTGCPLAGMEG